MFTWRPTPRLSFRTLAILRQYGRFANRRDYFGVDLLERSDPWERIPIGYFIDFTDPDHLSISRALMPFRWSWLSWGNQICEDWHVLKCQKEDPLALLWSGVQSSFRESRFEIVPDRRIFDGDVYYAIVEQVSYPKFWIVNREHIDSVCWVFQRAVDERMLVDGVRATSK